MALVDPSCFKGLSSEDQREQIFEAVFDWAESSGASTDGLVQPDCFKGASNEDQAQQIYAGLHAIQAE